MRRALLIVLTASTIAFGAPRLFELAKLTRALLPMTMAQRRETLFGAWYRDADHLRETLPRDAVVDLVMSTPDSRDVAVLSGAVLQPRRCQFFDGWQAWHRRERAIFLHDARAANAPPAVPVQPAQVIIEVTPNGLRAVR